MLSKYFTAFLSCLIILNLAIVIFIAMEVGWQQMIDVPRYVIESIKDPNAFRDPSRFPNRRSSTIETSNPVYSVSGLIDDPNVKLVSFDETFATASSKARPAVVNISSESISPMPQFPGDTRFDDPSPDLASLGGIGSGIIVHADGYILTCNHIVSSASNIFVVPFGPDVKRYRARVVAKEESLNLALLKITSPNPLPSITTGNSAKMEVADVVLAIGSPFGLEQSVTHGIISDNARDVLINQTVYTGLFQTDAPINRGSSGGPLININGEVVGINMAIYSSTGFYNGVSFALPINKAKPFLARTIPQYKDTTPGSG